MGAIAELQVDAFSKHTGSVFQSHRYVRATGTVHAYVTGTSYLCATAKSPAQVFVSDLLVAPSRAKRAPAERSEPRPSEARHPPPSEARR